MTDLMRRAHDSLELQRAGHRAGANVALFAAMATEAFINDVMFMLKDTPLLEGDPKLIAAASLMSEVGDRVSLFVKFELLYYLLAGKAFPKDQQTWSDFKFLIKIRNEIAHLKVLEISPERTYGEMQTKIVTELKSKGLLARSTTVLPQGWTMLLDESVPFGEWAIKTAQDIVCSIYTEIPPSCVKRIITSLVSPESSLMGGNRIRDGQLIRGRDILKLGT